MAVLSEKYNSLAFDCKGREQDACSYSQNQGRILPDKEPCGHEECVRSPTILGEQNVKEGGKQEKEEKRDGGKTSGI